jgi:polyisoprenoid-binding protein YceI
MKKISLIVLSFVAAYSAAAQSTWNVDKSHSKVQFVVSHMVVSEVTGHFKDFNGKLASKGNSVENADITFTINVKSVDTDDAKRDEHLLAPDFFDAEKYPTITFKSSSFKKISDKKYKLTGDLTMHGVTKKIDLDVTYGGEVKDPWGKTRSGYKIKGLINRNDYGVSWSKNMDAGGLVVGEDVELNIAVELVKE